MESLTIEFQRFGDKTGIIRLSDRYIRTIGTTGPASETGFKLTQEALDRGMEALDYQMFKRRGATDESVLQTARWFLKDIRKPLGKFLMGKDRASLAQHVDPIQLEVVARAQELAQLPFEALEKYYPQVIITRRIRQTWPLPRVNRGNVPKVLFAWAEPKKRPQSRQRMEVPHARHLKLLDQLLEDWGGKDETVVEVPNASLEALKTKIAEHPDITHVHILAHGIPGKAEPAEPGQRIDLDAEPTPAACLALESDEGDIDRCSPAQFGALFSYGPRPEAVAIATCHSGEIDPTRSGATLAHAVHENGVPIVVASQLALTKEGSDTFIDCFLANLIDGNDPRVAVRKCRERLRERESDTYFDWVAVVGYLHMDVDAGERLKQRRFDVELARLKAISGRAEKGVSQVLSGIRGTKSGSVLTSAIEEIRQQFEDVRRRLDRQAADPTLTKAQLEELRGLQGSSLKREAEAAWKLAQAMGPDGDGKRWIDHSREALEKAASAYETAARISRDHHWAWVQWLSLSAVLTGDLTDHKENWIAARLAALDTVSRVSETVALKEQNTKIVEKAIWGYGSLCELYLLADLFDDPMIDQARGALDTLVRYALEVKDDFPVNSTLAQLDRYSYWWGDRRFKLPASTVQHAEDLRIHLQQAATRT